MRISPVYRLAALLMVLGLVVAACGESDDADDAAADADDAAADDADEGETGDDADDAAADEQEEVVLEYYNWDPAEEERELELLEAFEEEYPHITVNFESVDTPEYWTRAEAMAASNSLPDVMYMSSGYVEEWMNDELIVSLQEYVDADIEPIADEYNLDAAEDARHAETGDLHAFPYAFVTTILYYNADMFEEAGVAEPSMGWTWDDFLEAAQATTVGEQGSTKDVYGHYMYGRYTNIESWIFNNDGHVLTEDGEVAFDENAVEALEFLESLVHEHEVAPEPREMEGIDDVEVFGRGLSAMWIDGIWQISSLRDVIGDDFDWRIAPIPRGPSASEDVAYGWSDLLAITADSDHPDEAWLLIDWLTGENRPASHVDAGKLPIYLPTAESEDIIEPDEPLANQELIIEWGELTGPTSYTQGWGEWRGYTGGDGMEAFIDELFNGRMSLEEAIERTETRGNEVLGRFGDG